MTNEWWNLPRCPHNAHGHNCAACLEEAAILFSPREYDRSQYRAIPATPYILKTYPRDYCFRRSRSTARPAAYCFGCRSTYCVGEHGEDDYLTEVAILGVVGDRG